MTSDPGPATRPSLSSSSLRVGLVIAGFEFVKPLGEGGMGQVWMARQVSLDRFVAIKVLTPKLAADEQYVQRFRLEAQAAARLNHPNIVQVIEQGADAATNTRYIAFEFIDGSSLEGHLRKIGRLVERDALRMVRDVADALRYAQEKGLVHRDVKPDNILLTKEGVPKLADLGLAKLQDDASGPKLTQTGIVMGTPHYMAPEQALGERTIDARADVYALGLVLYRALTGGLPWNLDSALAILTRHINEDCPDPRKLVPEVTEATAQLVRDMTARDPKARLHPAEVVRRVDAILHAGATGASPMPSFAAPAASRPVVKAPSAPAQPAVAPAPGDVPLGVVAVVCVLLFGLAAIGTFAATHKRRKPGPPRVQAPPPASSKTVAAAVAEASGRALDPDEARRILSGATPANEGERAVLAQAKELVETVGEVAGAFAEATSMARLRKSGEKGKTLIPKLLALADGEAPEPAAQALRLEARAWASAFDLLGNVVKLVLRTPFAARADVRKVEGASGGEHVIGKGWREAAYDLLLPALADLDAGRCDASVSERCRKAAVAFEAPALRLLRDAASDAATLADAVRAGRGAAPIDVFETLRPDPESSAFLASRFVTIAGEHLRRVPGGWTASSSGLEARAAKFPMNHAPALIPLGSLYDVLAEPIQLGTVKDCAQIRLHLVRRAGSFELWSIGGPEKPGVRPFAEHLCFARPGSAEPRELEVRRRRPVRELLDLVEKLEAEAARFGADESWVEDLQLAESGEVTVIERGKGGNMVTFPAATRSEGSIWFRAANLRLDRITIALRRLPEVEGPAWRDLAGER